MLGLAHLRGGVVGLGIVTERGAANGAVMEMILNSIRAAPEGPVRGATGAVAP